MYREEDLWLWMCVCLLALVSYKIVVEVQRYDNKQDMESNNKGKHNSDTVVPLHETPPVLRDHHVHAPKMHLAITSSGRPPLYKTMFYRIC